MPYLPEIDYPEFERAKLIELDKLFQEWDSRTKEIELPEGYTAESMVFDGFYPYYTKQKEKILFIGRESREISGCNYIQVLFNAYKNKRIGNQHINVSLFHRRMFYIAYGINNGFPKWQDIPYADRMTDTFGTEKGISFSFMNISKFSNDSDSWQSNWDLIEASYKLGMRSLIEREIEILEPDIIISMNIGDKIHSFGEVNEFKRTDQVNSYILNNVTKKNVLLLDTFHFAAWAKDDIDDFYTPIIEAIKAHKKN
ncbi:MAG TPA: hypothetical protein DET40_04860 [Lentisphaeria bacterium]|nr:MAG: hypothetical protein A2X45_13435 [Lentisphaerae bacterium GWF2_50_93]HCE42856.1 hypothetical protein [Lentisphaeria bacterium]